MVNVIKTNESLVRETVDKKKCIIVFGVKEIQEINKAVREKELKEIINKMVGKVQEKGRCLVDEVEEYHRVGKFTGEGHRPIRIEFKLQKEAEEALTGAWRLAKDEVTKNIWLRRDLNEKERKELIKMKEEVKAKNKERSEDQKETFYWRVLDMKVRKWYLNRREDR